MAGLSGPGHHFFRTTSRGFGESMAWKSGRFLLNSLLLYNIDGHFALPSSSVPAAIGSSPGVPIRFFLESDELQSDAIMQEIERRQPPAGTENLRENQQPPATSKVARPKKAKGKVEGQTEFSYPIITTH